MALLTCIVVTPEAQLLHTQTEFVALPLYDGEIGIAPGRAPLIGRLGYGEMRIKQRGLAQRFYVDGGIVEVADNVVSVLTDRLIPSDQIDPLAAREQLRESLHMPITTAEQEVRRDRCADQSRALIRVSARR